MIASRWILMIVCYCTISKVNSASTSPRLEVGGPIQALGDDVPVKVYNVRVGDMVELFYNNQSNAITGQVVTKTTETLIFNCGYFFKTGIYNFKLKSSRGYGSAFSRTVKAVDRPKILVEWTKGHRALSTDVQVSMKVKGSICKSHIARQNRLSLKLSSHEEETSGNQQATVIEIFPLMTLSDTFVPATYVIPCEKFNKAGTYKVELIMTSTIGDDVTLSKSEPLNVEWSKDYDMKLSKHSFPCTGSGVKIALTFPPCASPADKIRLLSISNGTRNVLATKLKGKRDHVSFPCASFYNVNRTVEGFCFEYVTESGHVTRTVCEPVSDTSGFQMSGSWSPWTDWSKCERPCQRTVKRRKRVCDNPKPYGNGKLCANDEGQESTEEVIVKGTSNPWGECDSDIVTSQKNRECECGCSIMVKHRDSIISSLNDNCDVTRTLIWTVRAPEGKAIIFNLKDFQLARDEVLTVRDGAKSWSMTSEFSSVTSRTNLAIIQLVRSTERNNLDSCGFILSFEVTDAPPTVAAAPETTTIQNNDLSDGFVGWIEKTLTDNTVVIAGIGACVLIIAIAVIVVVVHRRRRSKRRSKIPLGLRTPQNPRLAMPPDGRSCSNADDTESEPMVRPRPIGTSGNGDVIPDSCIPMQPTVGSSTTYYLAQRQLEIMRRLGKDEHSQTYATGCLSDDAIRQQEELLFGDRKSLHKKEDLQVT